MFNTNISLYMLMIMVALIANVITILLVYQKNDFSKVEIIGALIYENIGIIFGAKILTFIQNYNKYDKFDFLSLGMSSYGGVIGAIVFLIIFGLLFKKSIKNILLTFMSTVPLMYAIGKLGCFLVGCCYGIKYSGIGNVVYNFSLVAPNHVHLFPVQLVEAIIFGLISIYAIKNLKNKFDFKSLGIIFILCGTSKFCLDYLRMSHVNTIITINQIISILFVLIGLLIIYNKDKYQKN